MIAEQVSLERDVTAAGGIGPWYVPWEIDDDYIQAAYTTDVRSLPEGIPTA